jgi:starch synthase
MSPIDAQCVIRIPDADASPVSSSQPVIGILLDQSFDDWLGALHVSLNQFTRQMMGSWVFNYVQALQAVGVKPILFCVSEQVQSVTRLVHAPTGTQILVFPTSRIFRMLRGWLPYLFEKTTTTVWHGAPVGMRERIRRGVAWLIRSYLATPVRDLFKHVHGEGCRSLLVQEYESVRFDLCVIAGKLSGMPVFATFTGAFPHIPLLRPLRRIAMKLCDGLLICARSEVERVRSDYSVPAGKVALLHYPLDFTVWHPDDKRLARTMLGIPETSQVVIYHGEALLWVKGLDVLLNAWERICEERPGRDLQLVLIGTGADARQLSQVLGRKHLRGVEWLNKWINDRALIRRYLSAADVYAFPSRSDAFGISIIEAMACGLPVVAGNVRGIRDIFLEGEESGGLLVAPANVDALMCAIARLLDDSGLAQELGQRARRNAQAHFSMEQIGMKLSAVLLKKQKLLS